MRSHDRRRFVAGVGAAFALGSMSAAVRAQLKPDDKFDLVIKGGELLDPGQKLRGRRDIGFRCERLLGGCPVGLGPRRRGLFGRRQGGWRWRRTCFPGP